jgi:UDP:flavonoid glycosyltransferase YjiC (YdhE family)
MGKHIQMKALFVPFAPSLAHVSRCLAVADAWRERGHVAIFAIGAERSALVHSAGFDARPVPEVAGAVFRADRGLRWFSPTYFSDNLAAEQAILAEVDPEIVVSDFRFTTSLSARLAGRPTVSILHGNALRFALHPRETARLLIGDRGSAKGIAALRVLILRQLFPIVFQLVMRVVARRWAPLLKAYGCPPVNSPFELLLGDEMLVADLPDLLPPKLPPHTHIVGPLMWSGWEQPASWLDEFDNRPLVYVTMGSTVEAQAVLIKMALPGFEWVTPICCGPRFFTP